jgi:hypothetical protein
MARDDRQVFVVERAWHLPVGDEGQSPSVVRPFADAGRD